MEVLDRIRLVPARDLDLSGNFGLLGGVFVSAQLLSLSNNTIDRRVYKLFSLGKSIQYVLLPDDPSDVLSGSLWSLLALEVVSVILS